MAEQSTAPESVSAPAGTGNAPGFGEAFSLDLNTGQASYTVPIPVPKGIGKATPTVQLAYRQSAGPSPFGLGWMLPTRSVERRLDLGVPDDGVVARYLADGAEIVEVSPGRWRARRESAFDHYLREGEGWVVHQRDGLRLELGMGAAARVVDPDRPDAVVSWLVERSVDTSGNEVRYRWDVDAGTPYLREIGWAAYTLRLHHTDRPDVVRNGRAGFLRLTRRRCTEIELLAGGVAIRRWTLGYDQAPLSGASLLTSVQLTSLGPATDGGGDVARPAQRFGYALPDPARWRARFVPHDPDAAPPPLGDPGTVLTPLDRGPLAGVLAVQGGRFTYWPGRADGGFTAPHRVAGVPVGAVDIRDSRLQVADIDGDGRVDLLVGVGSTLPAGFASGGGAGGWDRYVAYPRGSAVPGLDPGTRFVDLDGDGRADALVPVGTRLAWWRNRGADGWDPPRPVRVLDGSPPDLTDPGVFVADMTGDGLADLVRVRSGRVEYWPNLGHGRFGGSVVMGSSPRLDVTGGVALHLVDIDGDGCADLVQVGPAGIAVHPNRSGGAFGPPVVDALVPPPVAGTVAVVSPHGRPGGALLWCSGRGGALRYVEYDTGATGHLLTGTDNGAGLHAEISYSTAAAESERDRAAGEPWEHEVPFGLAVVAATTVRDVVADQTTTCRYRYHHGWFDHAERAFEGFARVEREEVGDTSRPTSLAVHHFLVAADRRPGGRRADMALNRLLARIEHFQLDGTPQAVRPTGIEETSYGLVDLAGAADLPRAWVTVERTVRRWTERTDDERAEERALTYDDEGNVVTERLRHFGTRDGAAVPEIVVATTVEYAAHPTGLVRDRASRIVRRDAAGALLGETQRFYDGPDLDGLPSGEVGRGLPTRELRWVQKAADFAAHGGADPVALGYLLGTDADGDAAVFAPAVRRAHDAAGRLVTEQRALGATTRYSYDPTGLFRERVTGPLGTTTTVTDPRTGQPLTVVDPDGTTVDMRYDAQGRLTSVVLPGDTPERPSRSYTYDDALPPTVAIARRISHGADATADSVVVFDGQQREFQRREVLTAGRVVVSGHVLRNPFGDVAAEYEPAMSTTLDVGPPDLTSVPRRFVLDSAGRPVRSLDHRGGVSTAVYRPFDIVTTDANGSARTERLDAAHRRLAVIESGAGGTAVTSTFTSDPRGLLLSHGDDHGEVSRSRYDGLGNRLEQAHRDAGTWRNLWDAEGRTARVVDPHGRLSTADYDALGRITTLTVDGAVLERYTYDDASGRLRTATYPGGSQTYGYDAQGRIIRRSTTVDGQAGPLVLEFAHDARGQLRSVGYPDGSVVTYERFDNGLLRAVPGFVDGIDYDARRLATTVRHANGVVTTTEYTAGAGRVATQRTVGPGGAVLEDVTHGYDLLGLCTGVEDRTPGSTGTVGYAYDALHQLTEVDDSRTADGPARFDHDGRRLVGNGEDGVELAYGDPVHAGRVTTLTSAAGPFALPYDAAGRITALPGRTLSWDAKGQLAEVSRDDDSTVRYGYDHRGQRVRKTVTSAGVVTDTVFLSAFAEVRDGVLTRFVVLDGRRVALDRPGERVWIHTDPRGSATFFTDGTGVRIARIAYRAFGNSASAVGSAPLQVFAFHEFDADAGLHYAQRRWYLAEAGRFVSPDGWYLHRPERGLDDPRRLDLYAYCAGDPVNNIDPDGASFWTVLGGIVGVVVGIAVAVLTIAAFASGIGFALLAVGLIVGLTIAGYAGAAAARGTPFGDFLKGMLIGFNAGLNLTFGIALLGPVIGIALGVINFLAVFDGIRQNEVYQGILGWSSWLMPMSWVVNGLGLVFFAINLILAAVTLNQVGGLAITHIRIDWATGSLIMKGGAFADANPIDTAYDMGNFVFVDSATTAADDHVPHELGHTLSLGAFGSAVHLIGFVDEMFLGNGSGAWTERMADSNAGAGTDDTWT